MPTPVAHSLAGYVVSRFAPDHRGGPVIGLVLLCVVMSNVPDLDFIPGLLAGRPALFHSGITHSLGFALLLSLAVAGLLGFRKKSFFLIFSLCFFSYLTHLLLDYLNPDGRPPYGIPFFWPLSDQYFISPIPIFAGVNHVGSATGTTLEFVRSVLSIHNLYAIGVEALLLAPFVLLGQWVHNRKLRRLGKVPLYKKMEKREL